jgi:general secretion pathway protein G
MKAASRKGFTLIEILIVVIILGILAAIVIPQFTTASDDARRSSAATLAQTLRSQIELYKLERSETPDLTTSWAPMLVQATYNNKATGPYLQEAPKNPLPGIVEANRGVVKATTVTAGVPAGQTACGFVEELATGRIWLVDKDGAIAY